jgi:hypothetical protein
MTAGRDGVGEIQLKYKIIHVFCEPSYTTIAKVEGHLLAGKRVHDLFLKSAPHHTTPHHTTPHRRWHTYSTYARSLVAEPFLIVIRVSGQDAVNQSPSFDKIVFHNF